MLDPSAWAAERILVTGHTGFKGAWLSLWLRRLGATVAGYAADVPVSSPSLHELVGRHGPEASFGGDIADAAAVRACVEQVAPTVVFHLAAQPLVRLSYTSPDGTFRTNVMGTAALLEALRASPGVKAIVVVTSDKCYLNRETDHAYTEDDPLGGHDPYSASKAAQEITAAAWRSSFFAPAGVGLATARAGNVIGGGDWGADRLVPDAVRAVADGSTLIVRRPDAVRPWQHVLCALHGYLMLAERLLRNDGLSHRFATAWNFGPTEDDCRPVSAVMDRLASLWPELRWEARPEHGAVHEAGLLRLDASRARAELGWAPAWDLDRALREIAAWHRAHLAGEDMVECSVAQIAAYEADMGRG